jgi:aryl-alcohol dehydrogenase-like predicted oxidoreductase
MIGVRGSLLPPLREKREGTWQGDGRSICDDRGVTSGQLALAWLLAQGEDIVPIPGTKRRKYLEENAGAADVALTQEDLRRIEAAMPRGSAAGERYTEEQMRAVGR